VNPVTLQDRDRRVRRQEPDTLMRGVTLGPGLNRWEISILYRTRWLLLPLILLVTVLVYLPGLPGPFLFDDHAHVSRNVQVHITDLGPASLAQAWNSSLAAGLGKRPLAQLSFGINHALAGLDTFSYKATNLAIHLLCGLLIYALVRQLTRSLAHGREPLRQQGESPWPALLVTALWLLHPLNLTPVLYVVQRMTSLSALFVLAGLWCHVTGRLRMATGDGRGLWLALAGLPLAAIGGLAKESAALYPLLVLVLEWTLLRQLAAPRRRLLIILTALLPILLGGLYLLSHLGLMSYSSREFTLEQRLLSEARILWIYLQWLLWPDPAALGLYHDDIATSLDLNTPWTTLPAVVGWLALIPLVILGARRWPVASFGLLFFLAAHLMESTVFPLELVFEHRNYLPSLGPLFALGWLLSSQQSAVLRRWLALSAVLLLVALAAIIQLRAQQWSEADRLTLTEVLHHPQSPRANFRTAQLMMDRLRTADDPQATYLAARHHLLKVRELKPDNTNALFGLMFLELFVTREPSADLLDALVLQLRDDPAGPTNLSIGNFAYLVRWLEVNHDSLPSQRVLAIMQAAIENPRLKPQGKAAVLSALRAYHDRVRNDLPAALPYARQAVRTWPSRWHYHYRLVQLLIRLGQWQEAQAAFDKAAVLSSAALNPEQRAELAAALRQQSAENLQIHD